MKAPVVVQFPTASGKVRELNFARPLAAVERDMRRPVAHDLSGVRKLYFCVGPGRVGKTTLLRWMGEIALEREAMLSLAAVDAGHRALSDFFGEGVVYQPAEGDDVEEWLLGYIRGVIAHGETSAAIDFGAAGESVLLSLLRQVPTLAQVLNEAGIEPVLVLVLSPREDDLGILWRLREAKFFPPATLFVLNLGTTDRPARFSIVRSHTVYAEAIARGAVEVEMPRNFAAPALDATRGLGFLEATSDTARLDVFNQARVKAWLDAMAQAFSPVASWLP